MVEAFSPIPTIVYKCSSSIPISIRCRMGAFLGVGLFPHTTKDLIFTVLPSFKVFFAIVPT